MKHMQTIQIINSLSVDAEIVDIPFSLNGGDNKLPENILARFTNLYR